MMRRETFALVAAGATLLGALDAAAQAPTPAATPAAQLPALPPAAPGVPATTPALPALPGSTPAAMPGMPGTVPVAPGATGQPGVVTQTATTTVVAPGTLPTLPGATLPGVGGLPGATAAAVPTPPPLGDLGAEAADTASDTTASISSTAAPSQLYTFLFIDDPDYGVVRQKFENDVAETLKEAEIQRLIEERRKQSGPNAGGFVDAGFADPYGAVSPYGASPYGAQAYGGQYGVVDPTLGAGMDPTLMGAGYGGVADGTGILGNSEAIRAAAEWDFYYDQLEMYDRYVREKLVPDAEDLPQLGFTADNALQERQDLFESFQEAAISQNNDDYNDNKQFYERLQKREDRRVAYRQWILMKQNEVAEWAEVWARNVFGTRWADGEEVRVDDWYYGTDFNSVQPVLIQVDDREYVVSKQPVGNLQDGQLNVVSNNLTPYDIVDANGNLKNPVMETLRGTLIVPPAAPVMSSETTGTIEIVGGVTTE